MHSIGILALRALFHFRTTQRRSTLLDFTTSVSRSNAIFETETEYHSFHDRRAFAPNPEAIDEPTSGSPVVMPCPIARTISRGPLWKTPIRLARLLASDLGLTPCGFLKSFIRAKLSLGDCTSGCSISDCRRLSRSAFNPWHHTHSDELFFLPRKSSGCVSPATLPP